MKDIYNFNNKFNSKIENKEIMEAINKQGINTFSINNEIIKENTPNFNVELEDTKKMDQKESLRCWIYSGLNFIKRDMAKNLNMNVLDFELSPTYIAFYDRLEKANSLYNNVINKNIDLKNINKDEYFDEPAHEKGRFELFKTIANKYGLVPYSAMPDTKDSLNSEIFNLIFNEKIKKDCIELIKCKKDGKDCYKLKDTFLYQDYELLCKILGEPCQEFNFTYTDLENKKVTLKNINPLQFKEKFLSINLNDYICILSIENYDRQFNVKYRKKREGNIYKKSFIEYVSLPVYRLKELVSEQLKDGLPVIFDCETMKFRDINSGVLDTRLYNYNKYIPFNKLSRQESINFKDMFARHVMTFTGVQIEDNKTIRWKVEDSYGENKRYNGYYIMNDNWFDDYVIGIVINKKYLTDNEIEVYNSKPIVINNFDAF
jgi:bleomycin hydrolase